MYEKTERVAALSRTMAERLGANADNAARAAELSKCDLMTEMVYEFTSLQGVMGRYYAINDGEDAEVANASSSLLPISKVKTQVRLASYPPSL